MENKAVKKRNWAFVAYPESLPEKWREILQETGLQCCISPLHDKDVEPTGEVKKAHFHIILCYSGPTAFSVVKRLTDRLCQPIPIPLEQVKGMYRYFTHLDNPDKYQYISSEITTINGWNIADYAEMSKSEITRIKKEIQEIIIEQSLFEYSELMDYLLFNDETGEKYEIACNNTMFFDRYISSKRNKEKEYQSRK